MRHILDATVVANLFKEGSMSAKAVSTAAVLVAVLGLWAGSAEAG
jgi:hypothetical protein